MGLIGWVSLVGVVVLAVVVLGVIDHFRGPTKYDGGGQPKPIMKRRVVNGQTKTLCPDCDTQ
ncbi:MAG: hypothetical protein IT433_05410 [Phycisphaerales bacterium]|nr:hypothetical protein [Phycisphaerales bacterium]